MNQSNRRRWSPWLALVALAGLGPAAASGQPGGIAPVGFTPARELPVQRSVRLPGTVEARVESVVASEVAGVVEALLVREGERVRAGQPMARLRRVGLELRLRAAEAQLAEARARLDLAARSLVRSRELFESGVISRQQLDDAVSESDAWQGRVDQASAEIARLRDEVERSTIVAPFDGVVVREHTEVGEWIAAGGEVVELVDPEDLEIVVEVPERHFADARTGVEARITLQSLPELEILGRVTALIPKADPQARTFPVKIRVDNRGRRIGIGMLAQVTFPVGEPRLATVVPKDAVVARGPQRMVYVLRQVPEIDGRPAGEVAETVSVELGAATGDWVEVRGAVRPGDHVVTRGNERLRPGQRVLPEAVDYALP